MSTGPKESEALHGITTVLINEYVGFEEVDHGLWTVYYSTMELGRFDERTFKLTDMNGDDCRKPLQSPTAGTKWNRNCNPSTRTIL